MAFALNTWRTSKAPLGYSPHCGAPVGWHETFCGVMESPSPLPLESSSISWDHV